MALAVEERSELSQDLANNLSPEHEVFASQVASGISYRNAAKIAGFAENHGFQIMQLPRIRARVAELLTQPDQRVKAGINAELLMLRNRVADAELTDVERANVELRLKLLMAHAKIVGMIVERKAILQRTATIALDKLPPDQIKEHLSGLLDQLDPGARTDIQRRLAAPADVIDAEILDETPTPEPSVRTSPKPRKSRKTK